LVYAVTGACAIIGAVAILPVKGVRWSTGGGRDGRRLPSCPYQRFQDSWPRAAPPGKSGVEWMLK
jgi:hypothetical protein